MQTSASSIGEQTTGGGEVTGWPARDCPASGWLQASQDGTSANQALHILDCLVLRLEPGRHHCEWSWRRPGAEKAQPLRQQPDLLAPLLDPEVLALFGDQWLKRSPAYDRLNVPTMAACREAMRTRLRKDPRLADWQSDWWQTLSACQPEVFELARHARPSAADALSPSLYSLVWRHQAMFRDLANNAPALLPLLAIALKSGWQPPRNGDVLHAIKAWICELPSCGPATWRWLLRQGVDAFHPMLTRLDDDPWKTINALLVLWSRAGLPPMLPEPVLDQWAGTLHRACQFALCCAERIALVAEYAAGLDATEAREQAAEITAALEHAAEPLLAPMDRNQKRAGWPWLIREMRHRHNMNLLDEFQLATARDRLPATLPIGGFDIVILRTLAALAEEGQRMNNCMQDNAESYLADRRLHFSIRCPRSGKSLATCSLVSDGCHLALFEVLGYENRPPSGAVKRVARRLIKHPRLLDILKKAIGDL